MFLLALIRLKFLMIVALLILVCSIISLLMLTIYVYSFSTLYEVRRITFQSCYAKYDAVLQIVLTNPPFSNVLI